MSSVNEKLDATETGYGSIKDEPKTGGGLKFIVVGMLIGTFIGVLGTMALITPHAPLAQFYLPDCEKITAATTNLVEKGSPGATLTLNDGRQD